jgi:hypothetical protein
MMIKDYLQLEPAGCMAAEKDETVAGGQKGDSSMMLTVVALTAAFAIALLAALLASVMLEDVAQPARTVVESSKPAHCIQKTMICQNLLSL